MRVAKFKIPVSVFPEFLKYTQPLGLKSIIISTTKDAHEVEVPFTKEQNSLIDELEQIVEILLLATVIGILALNVFIEESNKKVEPNTSRRVKKESSVKSELKNNCYFKDYIAQAKKADAEKRKP